MDGQPIGPPKRSGCIVALYALFGVGLFFLVVGGIGVWLFLQSERGQEFVKAVKDGAEWATVAAMAPGTEELREAGCEVAMVSSASSAFDLFSVLLPAASNQEELRGELEAMAGGHDLDEMQLVICTIQRLDLGAPGCDTLARTYAGAVATTSEAFYVLLVQQGGNEPICQGVYAPDGSLIAQPDLESP